jgi:hypothetical protein
VGNSVVTGASPPASSSSASIALRDARGIKDQQALSKQATSDRLEFADSTETAPSGLFRSQSEDQLDGLVGKGQPT